MVEVLKDAISNIDSEHVISLLSLLHDMAAHPDTQRAICHCGGHSMLIALLSRSRSNAATMSSLASKLMARIVQCEDNLRPLREAGAVAVLAQVLQVSRIARASV